MGVRKASRDTQGTDTGLEAGVIVPEAWVAHRDVWAVLRNLEAVSRPAIREAAAEGYQTEMAF